MNVKIEWVDGPDGRMVRVALPMWCQVNPPLSTDEVEIEVEPTISRASTEPMSPELSEALCEATRPSVVRKP